MYSSTKQHPNLGAAATSASAGPRAKCDQVVFEALCKACEVIVGSRTSTSGSDSTNSNTINNNNNTTNNNHANGVGATTTSAPTNSSRFNLQIPEVAGVRSILSQFRLQLHVPLRLDVFYQHPDGNRELLERWSLEYKAVSSNVRFTTVEGMANNNNNDPMVQLTHVCKRVVLWLRTLYCWTRLLPAHAVGGASQQQQSQSHHHHHHTPRSIGFSIYAHADFSSDDMTELVTSSHPGFDESTRPRGVGRVTTPYGELAWRVVHCAQSQLDRLVPSRGTGILSHPQPIPQQTSTTSIISPSRPIPMKKQPNAFGNQHHHQQQQPHQHQPHHFAPRSAPSARPPTYTERSQQKQLEAQRQHQNHQHQHQHQHQQQQHQQYPSGSQHRGMSYDPSRFLQRSATARPSDSNPLLPPSRIQRSLTSIADEAPSSGGAPPMPSTGAPPERVLSGLTLALLMANNNDDDDDTTTDGTAPKSDTHHRDPSLNEQHTIREDYVARNIDENSVAERTRRAALHEMPRHLLEQQHDHHHHHPHAMLAAASGDYGYGYNNHIPWQKIHPSQSNPALDLPQQQQYPSSQSFGRTLSTSPASVTSSPLHTIHSIPQTPPGAIFLGATPPHKGSNLGQHHFIPPRNRTESRSITPPFQPRPLGFAHDPPTLHLESQQLASNRSLDSAAKESGSMKAPVSSLDSLRSSPFQQQETLSLHPDSRSMMLSSLSYAPALGSDGLSNMMPNSASGDLRRSLWGGASGAVLPSSLAGSVGLQQHPMFQQHEDYYSEEMPFAVELPSVSSGLQNDDAISQQGSSTARPTSCSSSYLGTSAALTTLAHKCGAPNQRLKLLDNRNVDPLFGSESRPCAAVPDDNPMSSLANQLEEFRTFGASLHVSTMDPSNLLDEHLQGSGASSSTTPSISLRS